MKRVYLFASLAFIFLHSSLYSQMGVLDDSFGGDGVIYVTLPLLIEMKTIDIQPDGKVLALATSGLFEMGGYSDIGLVRYKSSGDIDSTFGNFGEVITDITQWDDASCMAIQPDGKIIVGGITSDITLLRYETNGMLDTTFGIGGIAHTSVGNNNICTDIAMQSDGKILLTYGHTRTIDPNDDFAIMRFHLDGSIDTTFGSMGIASTDLHGMGDHSNSISLFSNGNILVGGFSEDSASDFEAMIKYLPNGVIDTTFGIQGIVRFDLGFYVHTESIEIQSDGKIVIPTNGNTSSEFGVLRVLGNGVIDSTFGHDGMTFTDFGSSPFTSAWACSACIQADQKIVVSGSIKRDFYGITRYLPDGSLDLSFGAGGLITSEQSLNIPPHQTPKAMNLQADNKILIAGESEVDIGGPVVIFPTISRFLTELSIGILDFSTPDHPILIYPNPVQSTATLEYSLNKPETISIELFNLQGQRIKTLVEPTQKQQGSHKESLVFSGDITAGIYLLMIGNGEESQAIRIIKK